MPGLKGVLKAARKPFRWLLRCVRPQKLEDQGPGFPEVQVTYADEGGIPEESLGARSSVLSLTDSDTDGGPTEADLKSGTISESFPEPQLTQSIPETLAQETPDSFQGDPEEPFGAAGIEEDGEEDSDNDDGPAEADLQPGALSDSLEDIPDILRDETPDFFRDWDSDAGPAEADLKPGALSDRLEDIRHILRDETPDSFRGGHEEPFGAEEKDGEKDSDSDDGPAEAEPNPGPGSERVPEPRTSNQEPSGGGGRAFDDLDELGRTPTYQALHALCRKFSGFTQKERNRTADAIAKKHLRLMLEHYMLSPQTACETLTYEVLRSPSCCLEACLVFFMHKANGGGMNLDSRIQVFTQLKAVRGIGSLIRDFSDPKSLMSFLSFYLTTLANVLVSRSEPLERGSATTFKTFAAPGEVIELLGFLLQRLDLVALMKDRFPSI